MTHKIGNDFSIEVANADDMMKQWPKSDLLLFCGFPKMARKSLYRWFWGEKDTLTLYEVFELVISSEKDPRPGYLISKMLDARCVGKKTFLGVMGSMAELDFGKQCNLVWKSKYANFLNAHRVKGSCQYGWSFPITDEGSFLAKFRNGARYLPRRRKKPGNQG